MNLLATQYADVGDYSKAEPLFRLSLKIWQKARGLKHPDTAIGLNNLAEFYTRKGYYPKAEPLYQRALEIDKNALGAEHRETGSTVHNLARLYQLMGDYAKAEPLYRRAIKIREKALGLEHTETAKSLNGLALLYDNMGDYLNAELLYKRAREFTEKALGPNHPDTAGMLNNLAVLYYHTGDYAKADPLYQRVTEICERTLGPWHPHTAISVNNRARLSLDAGEYLKAERLFQQALQICEKTHGPNHPMTARCLNGLAIICHRKRNYLEAEQFYRRALKVREKALGPQHPDTADTLNNLAWAYIDLGNPKEGLRLAAAARCATEKTLSNILSFTSELQRLAFQKKTTLYALPATMGSASELAEIVLRHKGVVLDSLVEDRLIAEASGDPRKRQLVVQLKSAKQRLMQLQLETPKEFSDEAIERREGEKQQLSRKADDMEATLARQVAGLGRARRALSVEVKDVQQALENDQALIELIQYNHRLGNDKWEPRYGAIIIAPRDQPKWVLLPTRLEIEKHINLYKKAVRGKANEAVLSTVVRALYAQLWEPIENFLPSEVKTIIISPDAELNFVSFATLVSPDNRFLGEKYSIRYVASGRDLLRQHKDLETPSTCIFADPDFEHQIGGQRNSSRAVPATLRLAEVHDLQDLWFSRLSGTAAEAAALKKLLGENAAVFLESKATEAELRQVNSPPILHLATHGFFLPEVDLGRANDPSRTDKWIPKGKLLNPMHRSGLALAGAQQTLAAWIRGEVPSTENDGIVTAEEVGGLNLTETWLVVLSACDTGLGEARAGEGVMGLRRGFVQAGAQNLLMTLWPISDQTTVDIMLDFYASALKNGNAPQSLAEVQRRWLVTLRKEHGLLSAVRLAGAFIVSSQGKQ